MEDEKKSINIKSPFVWGNCLGMAVVSCLFVVGTLFLIRYYTHHGENIAVPNLRGLSYGTALNKMESLGLGIEVTDSGYVRTLPPDAILEQQIRPGTEVKTGRVIYVTVNSANSPTITMPDLADNCSLHEARARLTAIGFRLAPIEYIAGERNWVYAIKVRGNNVVAGQRVPVDAPVTIVVGDGNVEEEYNGYGDLEDYLYGFDEGGDSLVEDIFF